MQSSLSSSSSQSKLKNYSFPYFNNKTILSSSIELQEETILEKQIVRISPSLHKKDVAIPITTYFTNGQQFHHHNHQYHHQYQQQQCKIVAANSKISYGLKLPLRYIISAENDGGNLVYLYGPKVSQEDKECQTEDFLQNMDNRVNGIAATEDGDNTDDQQSTYHLYPKVINCKYGLSTATMIDRSNDKETRIKEFLSSQMTDTDSKDCKLKHVDIVISESKYICNSLSSSSSNDVIDVATAISTQPKKNGTVHSHNLNELKSIANYYDDKRHQPLKDEEEDTCCMNCFLITLNICNCVIL